MVFNMTHNGENRKFLFLLAGSLLLHLVLLLLIIFGKSTPPVQKEPIIVELRDLPQPVQPPASKKRPQGRADVGRPVFQEPVQPVPRRNVSPPPQKMETPRTSPTQENASANPPRSVVPPDRGQPAPGESLFKPRQRPPADIPKLFPRGENLARLEESYRQKYGSEVEQGDAVFLDTEDILFGSFLRRFDTAVYGIWSYPEEASARGIQGVTSVRITFNRRGEIENVTILEGSGSSLLDDEVLRTLHHIGPIGSLPKGYGKDRFKLIAFFRYGIIGGKGRGSLQ